MKPFEAKGYTQYGAWMGRNVAHLQLAGRIHLQRVRLDAGGYDKGGAYWGHGEPLWCGWDDDGNAVYVRAITREAAKAKFPGCSFYR